ncbi:hypothetical protein BB561_001357 [Smittium simulii]|uniref:Uncharacterized protein n=1 Tax=Smittium simulii TaxID=133385 RepID=A0A2T9YV73_9FUNG|nr:hypothetical protein BB561_001357 [Smittium simulii]
MGQNTFTKNAFGSGSLNFAAMYKKNKDTNFTDANAKPEKSCIEDLKDNVNTNYLDDSVKTTSNNLLNKSGKDTKNEIQFTSYNNSVNIKGHEKTISAIDWDKSGATMATGGYDYLVKLWNFGTMDASFQSFREIEPAEGCQVNDISFSSNGENFLVATTSSQAKLFDKSGLFLQVYKKGDMYIRDMRHTSGHVSSINSCLWNPQNKQEFLTASDDSTVRIWDPDYYLKQKQHIEKAHDSGNFISSLEISPNETKLLSRSEDQTIKLWDVRSFKSPIATAYDINSCYYQANACFSPDGKFVLAATGATKIKKTKELSDKDSAKLVFMDSGSLNIVNQKSLSNMGNVDNKTNNSSEKNTSDEAVPVKVCWHKTLNQIAVSKSDGTITICYDDEKSIKGAKLCVSKAVKIKSTASDIYTGQSTGKIITPNTLPLFKESTSRSSKRRMEKIRKDPIASHRPELPVRGQGRGGVIGTSETQYIMRSIIKDTTRDQDPREALLKHAAAAEESPYWVAPAYKKNQPKSIFNEKGMEDEPELKRRK